MGATAGGIRAGRAFVELYADSTKLQADLRNVEAKFKALGTMVANWGKALTVAGAAALTPLLALSKLAATTGDNLVNMSKRTGISVEALSALDYAASQSGTTLEAMETGVKNMQKGLVGLGEESKGVAEALGILGLSAGKLQAMSPDDQFKAIAEAVGKVKNPAERAAIALKVFGKSGTELLPMLREGKGGIEELMQRAADLGLIMSTKDAMAANAFNDKLSELYRVAHKAGVDIGLVLIPALTGIANAVEKVVKPVMDWLRANKELVIWAALVGAGLFTAGVAMFIFGKTIAYSMTVLQGMQSALTAVWGVVTAIGGAIVTIATSPMLLLVAAIVGVGVAFLWLSGAGGKAIDWLGARFADLQKFASDAFHGIADALIAGDIQLAAEILWQSLAIAWRTGVNALEMIWLTVKKWFVEIFYGAVDGALAAWEILQSGLAAAWINTIAGLKMAWVSFSSWYKTAVEGLANIIAVELYGADQAYVDQQTGFNVNQIDQEKNAQMVAIEAQRKGSLAANRTQSATNLAGIGQDYQNRLDTLKTESDLNTTEGQMRLRRLNEDMQILLNQAKNARAFADGQGPNIPGPPELAAGLAAAQKASFGTFSAQAAAAAGGVGGASVLETAAKKTAENTAKTADGVAALLDAAETGGLTFT